MADEKSWEIHIDRLGIQKSGTKQRTYATYQVLIGGKPVKELSGHICECIGPGDLVPNGGKRIPQGRYPLSTQFGKKYRTSGFVTDTKVPGKEPMPGLLLMKTKPRTAILIHPGHPPTLYLSSVGCLNPTNPLRAKDEMVFLESRARTIALIDSLRAFPPSAFKAEKNTPIPNAFAVIEGEPTKAVPALTS